MSLQVGSPLFDLFRIIDFGFVKTQPTKPTEPTQTNDNFSITVVDENTLKSANVSEEPEFTIQLSNVAPVSSAVTADDAPQFNISVETPVEVSSGFDPSVEVKVTNIRDELASKAAEVLLSGSSPKVRVFTITRQEDTFPRLIRVSAQGKSSGSSYSQEMTTSLVPLNYVSLNTKDMFILDNNDTVYQWGNKPSLYEKSYTTQITRALDDQRKSAVNVKVLDNLYDEKDSDVKEFWTLMGVEGTYPTDLSNDDSAPGYHLQLYSIESSQFKLVAQGKSIKEKSLNSKQVMLLDTGFEIFIWIGKQSPKNEQSYATLQAHSDYIKDKQRPEHIKVTILLEGCQEAMFDFFLRG